MINFIENKNTYFGIYEKKRSLFCRILSVFTSVILVSLSMCLKCENKIKPLLYKDISDKVTSVK